jgi:hypothetical protein
MNVLGVLFPRGRRLRRALDRAGMGWSDPGQAVLSAGMLADDPDRLLIT